LIKRGEIRFVSLDPASGNEQKGCNRLTKIPIVLAITSGGNFACAAGFAVPLACAGIETNGVVRCDQPRALDLAARSGRKLETVPDTIMDEVLARISPIFQ
jgi:mRNA-degrading endonuclease toxin of MazEF toxin-antitoxin module